MDKDTTGTISLRFYMDHQKELKYYMTKEYRNNIESYLKGYPYLNDMAGSIRCICHVLRWIRNQD